jgi:flagellar biogenesis protein FliO
VRSEHVNLMQFILRGRSPVLGASPARYDTILDGAEDRPIQDRSLLDCGLPVLRSSTAECGRIADCRLKGLSLSKSWVLALFLMLFFGMNVSADTLGTTNLSSTAAVAGSALPDAGGSVIRVFGALILVIAIFLGGVWLYRNWQRFAVKKSGGARLNLLEVKSLGQRQALYVVGYQEQRMLLASSPAGITLVSHLPAAEAVEAVKAAESAPAPGTKMSFAEAFQHVLTRKS